LKHISEVEWQLRDTLLKYVAGYAHEIFIDEHKKEYIVIDVKYNFIKANCCVEIITENQSFKFEKITKEEVKCAFAYLKYMVNMRSS
jgi:hypothetical protein